MEINSARVTKKIEKKGGSKLTKVYLAICTVLSMITIPAYCGGTDPELTLNFDMEQMFEWAQMILDVMMPVVYITLGVALAFIIIRALKSAFA